MKRRAFLHALNLGIASATLSNNYIHGKALSSLLGVGDKDKELSYHRIKDIKFSSVQMNYPRLVGKNARLDLHGYGPIVEICCIWTNKED